MPELPQSTTSADAASASTPWPSTVIPEPATVIDTPELRERATCAVDVVATGQPDRARAAVGHRREQQRAVRDALVAGDPQAPAQRRGSRDRQLVLHASGVRAVW